MQRTVVDDLGLDTSADDQVLLPGGRPVRAPGRPGLLDRRRPAGPGTQQLELGAGEGDWTLVVMNADGSAGVAVDARIGATVPALTGLAWGLLGGGLFLLAARPSCCWCSRLRPSRGGPAGPPACPAGPPPYWAPPPRWTAARRPTRSWAGRHRPPVADGGGPGVRPAGSGSTSPGLTAGSLLRRGP